MPIHWMKDADAALGVRVGAFLLAPHRGGQHQVRVLGRRRRVIAVLHDEELEALERLLQRLEIGKRDDRIGRDDPKRTDLLANSSFYNVWIGQSPRAWDTVC